MIYLVACALLVLPVVIAPISPRAFVYFALCTGIVPIGIDEALPTPIGALHVDAIKLFGVLIGCGVCCLRAPQESFAAFGRFKIHLAFLYFCALSILWAPDFAFALRMLAKLTGPFLFLVVVAFAIRSEKHLEQVLKLVILMGLLTLGFAGAWEAMGYNERGSLTVPDSSPSVFSAHLLPAFAACCAMFSVRRKPLYLFFAALLALGVLGGFTRITIAAMFASGSIIFFLSARGVFRIALPAGLIVAFFALFLFVDEFRERMFLASADSVTLGSTIGDPMSTIDKIPGSGRFAAWELVLEKFFEPNPLVGSGIGATQHFFYGGSSTQLGVIHSEVIRLLAEVGIIGLLLFAFLAAGYAVRLLVSYSRALETEPRVYALAALGSLVAYVIYMLTDNAFDYVNPFAIYVFALVGVAERSRVLWPQMARTRTRQPEIPRIDRRTAQS